MATLGDLKARIILETNRGDLEDEAADQLQLSIERAIEYHADERFWFNSGSDSALASAATVARPATIRIIDNVANGSFALLKRRLAELQHLGGTGDPAEYAEFGDMIRLNPIPSSPVTLIFHGIAQIDAPAEDNDETVWTGEAYDLIAARTRFLLFRDLFRDVEGIQLAAQAEAEALTRLRRETRRRDVTPLRSPSDAPWLACRSGIML